MTRDWLRGDDVTQQEVGEADIASSPSVTSQSPHLEEVSLFLSRSRDYLNSVFRIKTS